MRQIEQLIEKYCPNGVEKKTLENVFLLRNGYTPSKANPEFWDNGTIPWYRMEDIRDKGRILSDSYLHITEAAIKGKGLFKANSFILATTATIGEHALLIADSLANQQFTNLQIRESLKDRIDVKFMYYYMFVVDDFCKNHTNKSGFSSVDMTELKRMLIPLPSLEIQKRIVEDLDKFAGIVDNLETELNLRRKQFEHYRDEQLELKGVNDVNWKSLGDVCKIKNGKDYKNLGTGNIPVWGTGGIMCYVDKFAYDKPSVLLPRKGSIDKIYYTESPFWNVDTLFYTIINTTIILPKFLYYYLLTINLVALDTSKGNRPSLTQTVLNNINIPLPSLEIQKRIVEDLDKFAALIANIEQEIALRQKQYEYYREQLLTF